VSWLVKLGKAGRDGSDGKGRIARHGRKKRNDVNGPWRSIPYNCRRKGFKDRGKGEVRNKGGGKKKRWGGSGVTNKPPVREVGKAQDGN